MFYGIREIYNVYWHYMIMVDIDNIEKSPITLN